MEKYFVKKIADKLMLASRDIQVGDKCRYRGFEGVVSRSVHGKQLWDLHDKSGNHLIYSDDLHELFKVIGEISSEALGYVKEGDEFDEDEISVLWICNQHGWKDCSCKSNLAQGCLIKGPCGHFH